MRRYRVFARVISRTYNSSFLDEPLFELGNTLEATRHSVSRYDRGERKSIELYPKISFFCIYPRQSEEALGLSTQIGVKLAERSFGSRSKAAFYAKSQLCRSIACISGHSCRA